MTIGSFVLVVGLVSWPGWIVVGSFAVLGDLS